MRRIAGHTVVVFAGVIIGYGATYVFYLACARALGVEGYGLLSSLLAIVQLGALPASLVTVLIAKRSATLRAQGSAPALAALAARTTSALAPIVIALVVLSLLGARPFAAFFRIDDTLSLAFVLIATALVAVLPLQRAVLQGTQNFRGFAISTIVEGSMRGAIGLIVLFAGGGLRLALAAFALAGIVAFFVNVRFLKVAAPGPRGTLPPIGFGEAALVALPLAALTLMTFADVVVARHALTPHAAGLYVAVSLIGRALITAVTALPTVLLPTAIARAMDGRSPLSLLLAALGAALAGNIVVLGVCAWNGPFVLVLLGGRGFFDGANLVLPYAAASAALSLSIVLATYLTGIHRTFLGLPLVAIAIAEPLAILAWASDAARAVQFIDVGHGLALTVCLLALLFTRTARTAAGVGFGGDTGTLT